MISNVIIDKKPISCFMCWDKGKPKHGTIWSNQKFFLDKLKLLEDYLIQNNLYSKTNRINCLLCSKKNISNKRFMFKNIMWMESMYHYVSYHNIKPPSKFIRFVLDNDPTIYEKCQNSFVRIKGKLKKLNKFSYVKIKTNQLNVLDALMEHGGITQKYKEKHEKSYKYSEHAGMLDFNDSSLDHIIVTGSSERTISNDPEIFFPNLSDTASFEYEYIFHTHPATPKVGGRAKEGILYEFPSANDLLHFVDHFNFGNVQGSLVITPEGLYNIRKNIFDKQKITPFTKKYFDKLKQYYNRICNIVQSESIQKYGTIFDDEFFYSVIAQDTSYIQRCNKILEHFSLYIDFFPRQKNKRNQWIIGTIYLPICLIEK
jgi:hypothetical protein